MTRRRKSLPTSSGVRSKYVPTSSGSGVFGVAEQEVLDLGSDVERQAHVVRARDRPSQDRARVALEQRALRRPDVAEHARHARHAGPPREDLERRRVGVRDHVGLLHPGEAVDRRAVEADALAQRLRQLLRGDRERLQEPEDVGEPQPDEPDLALLGRPDDERANVVVHPSPPPVGRLSARVVGPVASVCPTNVDAGRFSRMNRRLRTGYGWPAAGHGACAGP